MNELEKLVHLEIELEDLAAKYGFKLKHSPFWTYGPGGIAETEGPGLWPVYDENGELTPHYYCGFIKLPQLEQK